MYTVPIFSCLGRSLLRSTVVKPHNVTRPASHKDANNAPPSIKYGGRSLRIASKTRWRWVDKLYESVFLNMCHSSVIRDMWIWSSPLLPHYYCPTKNGRHDNSDARRGDKSRAQGPLRSRQCGGSESAHRFASQRDRGWVVSRQRLNEKLVAAGENGREGVRNLPNLKDLVSSIRAEV